MWDTVLSAHALFQSGTPADDPNLARAVAWLIGKQTRLPGDWAVRNPAPPGGWYFEMRNEFYPDVDDTCMALMVLAQARAAGATTRARPPSRAAWPGCWACRTTTAGGAASTAATTRTG